MAMEMTRTEMIRALAIFGGGGFFLLAITHFPHRNYLVGLSLPFFAMTAGFKTGEGKGKGKGVGGGVDLQSRCDELHEIARDSFPTLTSGWSFALPAARVTTRPQRSERSAGSKASRTGVDMMSQRE